MMKPVTGTLPLALTADMLRAVRLHPTTSTEDKEEEHRRMGWLLCAWDVLIEHRFAPQDDEVCVPVEPTEALLRPFNKCPPEELRLAWQAMVYTVRNKTPNVAIEPAR